MASPLSNSAIRPKRSAPNSNLPRKTNAATQGMARLGKTIGNAISPHAKAIGDYMGYPGMKSREQYMRDRGYGGFSAGGSGLGRLGLGSAPTMPGMVSPGPGPMPPSPGFMNTPPMVPSPGLMNPQTARPMSPMAPPSTGMVPRSMVNQAIDSYQPTGALMQPPAGPYSARTEQLYQGALDAGKQDAGPDWQAMQQEMAAQRSAAFDQRMQDRRAGNLDLQRNAVAGRMGIDPGRLDYVPHNQPGYSRWMPRPMQAPPPPVAPIANVDALSRPMGVGVGNYPAPPPPTTRQPSAPAMIPPWGPEYGAVAGPLQHPDISRPAMVPPWMEGYEAAARAHGPVEVPPEAPEDPYAEKRAALQKYLQRRRDERDARRGALIRPLEERMDKVHAREERKRLGREGRLAYRAQMQLPPRPLTAEEQMVMGDPRTAALVRGQNVEAMNAKLERDERTRQWNEEKAMRRDEIAARNRQWSEEFKANQDNARQQNSLAERRENREAAESERSGEMAQRESEMMQQSFNDREQKILDNLSRMEPGDPMRAAYERELDEIQKQRAGAGGGTGSGASETENGFSDADAGRYNASPLRTRLNLPDNPQDMESGAIQDGIIEAFKPLGPGRPNTGLSSQQLQEAATWTTRTQPMEKPKYGLRHTAFQSYTQWAMDSDLRKMATGSSPEVKAAAEKRVRALAKWYNAAMDNPRTPYPNVDGYTFKPIWRGAPGWESAWSAHWEYRWVKNKSK